jgi:hypothetical protein
VRTYRSRSGGFQERPFFKDEDIEAICLSELQNVQLLPLSPAPIRIDRFIEKRFRISHQYEDLTDGVLGLTVFGGNGVEAVIVARALDDEGTKVADRRIRSTLAHEAGHGLLHAQLFGLEQRTQQLFGDFSDPMKPKVLCRDVVASEAKSKQGYDGRWWEFQANCAMGCLLLPKALLDEVLQPFFASRGSFGGRVLSEARRTEAARYVSDVFDTNPIVARFRIDRLYPAKDNAQLSL